MNDDEAFLRAIVAKPDDDAPRLIYADFLEERNDPRGPALRQLPEFGRLLAWLATEPHRSLHGIEDLAEAGRMDALMVLLNTLRLPCMEQVIRNKKWHRICEHARKRIRRKLALGLDLAGPEALLNNPDKWESDTPSLLASILASGRPVQDTLRLIGGHVDTAALTELLACLAQELVLRGCDLADNPAGERLSSDLVTTGHLLATLPLALTQFETGLVENLARYRGNGSNWSSAYSEPADEPVAVPTGDHAPTVTVEEEHDAEAVSRIAAVHRSWTDGSNGNVEARIFRTDRTLIEEDVTTALLQSLRLAALAGLGATGIHAEFVSPARAFSILFWAACNGGAYTRGRLGAYGRLDMWESVGGLVGASAGESVLALAELAKQCVWMSVDTTSDWFFNVAWDFGLVVVRPDRRSLAVLMATDTD
jgi:uncharacterized protein (TIGR02996 family)